MNINICFSSSNEYFQHLSVAIVSILKNSSLDDEYNFFVMDGGISEKNKKKLQKLKKIRNFKIEYIKVNDEDFKYCPSINYVDYITLQTYYRFKIPSFFPYLDKILYMDCDIVVKTNIADLYSTDIENYYLAAVPEVFNHHHRKRLEYLENEFYCNAGVLLINNKKWKEDNIEQRLFEYALNPVHKIIHADQDVINEVLKGKIKYLNLHWNLQHDALFFEESYLYHRKERLEAIKNPYIIHYTNPLKPWNIECQNPLKDEYKKYLKLTPWKNYLIKMQKEQIKCSIKQFLKELGRVFYCKKKSLNKVKIKILGIPVYKLKKRDYLVKKYLFGIRFYKKKNQFLQIQDFINYKLDSLETKIEDKFNTVSGQIVQEITQSNTHETIKLKYELINNTSNNITAYNLHKRIFSKYKNINRGKDIVLVATGPSLKDFMLIKNAVYVGVNKAFLYDKVKFDYLFLQDYSGTTKTYIDDFINYQKGITKKFLGFLDYSKCPKCVIPDKYSCNDDIERYYAYHPEDKKDFVYDISTQPLGDAYSIAFPAMQFILWTNPKRIYLVGCDCSLEGYHNSEDKNFLMVSEVIEGWKRMKEFAGVYYPDTEIISINPVGLKGLFEDVYQNDEVIKNEVNIINCN